ncbi:MAG: COX15/CtaA family protein [Bacteroidetes bacterium]|nr:COX15/CtaA family protein [Bacteroidota bacterium]MCZ2132814.1 COX15/CtaA family protein [Bacteroidota bacterium]
MNSSNRPVIIWLLIGCALIFSMVVIGGITRLTGSGLSITEWNVVMGTIPPLNQDDWNIAFDKYQSSPQFAKINSHMGVEEFKSIFWWEYIHRLVGRALGIVFLIPFLGFLIQRKLSPSLIKKLLILFALGGLQGFLGWFMVASGLVDNPFVSHYRLAIHLIAAFFTFGYTFWIALDLIYAKTPQQKSSKSLQVLALTLFCITILQIIYGAFVAGLHAGKYYITFPTMNGEWIPQEISSLTPFWKNLTENVTGVQFVHRILAYIVLTLAVAIWIRIRKEQLSKTQKYGVIAIIISVMVQFVLGIITLLSAAPITLSALHQTGAFGVFASCVYFLHRLRK